jgi:hypothetical protein
MTRILIQYLLPLLLPTLLYFLWVIVWRRRKKSKEAVSLANGPWFWLILAGFALMVSTLSYIAFSGGSPPGGVYTPPHYEDGKVIPGKVE